MKKLVILSLILTGCASASNVSAGSGQFIATYAGGGTDTEATVIPAVMEIAKKQCSEKQVKVVKLDPQPRSFGHYPSATLVYECN